jgi:two-component system sensor histidine kinase BaeS
VRIHKKLLIIIFIYSTLLVGIMLFLMRWSVDQGMVNYVNTKEIEILTPIVTGLSNLYAEQDDWTPLENNYRRLRTLVHLNRPNADLTPKKPFEASNGRIHPRREPPPFFRRLTILDLQEKTIVGELNIEVITAEKRAFNRIPIEYQNKIVGWLVTPKRKTITDGFELQFLQQQQQTFITISLIVIALAAMIAYPLARHFVRPINRLAAGTQALTRGEYSLNLPIDRADELGQLARDFNELANTLGNNETSRKRWLADISHELRTPLSILRGELEAIIDGVRSMNEKNVFSLHQEIIQLQLLIDDLYQLSNSEIGGLRYEKTQVDLCSFINTISEQHRHKIETAGLTLTLDTPKTSLPIWGDKNRLNQLINNLLENSQKYTESNGKITVSIHRDQSTAIITINDSGPGVPDKSLPFLFDHLYRVDSSRNRNTGGSGLGLAICRQIVSAHGGTITASHSHLGGLAIEIRFPIDTITNN